MPIKVDGLYAEIGTDLSPLEQGLRRAGQRLGEFARDTERKGGAIDRALKGAFGSLSGRLAGLATLGAISYGLHRVFQEADRADTSLRTLNATARLTGVALSRLSEATDNAKTAFGLSASLAADLVIELTKLTSKSGDIAQTGQALQSFLDLGAARGYGAEQTLGAVRQAILGIDEGTDKLFGKNPSVLYAEYAAKIGKTAASLNDQQKAQALVNAAMEDGAKVRGEYLRFLDTAPGKQQLMAVRLNESEAALGRALAPARLAAIEGLTRAFEALAAEIEANRDGIGEFAEDLGSAATGIADLTVGVVSLASTISDHWDEFVLLASLLGGAKAGAMLGGAKAGAMLGGKAAALPVALAAAGYASFRTPAEFQAEVNRRNARASVGEVSAIPGGALQRYQDSQTLLAVDRLREAAADMARRQAEANAASPIARPLAPIDEKAAEELKRALEDLDRTIQEQVRIGLSATGASPVLSEAGREAFFRRRDQREAFTAAGGRSTPVQVRRTGVGTIVPASGEGRFDHLTRSLSSLLDRASEIERAASGFHALAEATGSLDASATRAVGGVLDLVRGMDQIRGGGLFGVLGGAAGLVGGAVSIFRAITDDPRAEEQTRILEGNLAQLRQIEANTRGFRVTGGGLSATAGILDTILGEKDPGDYFERWRTKASNRGARESSGLADLEDTAREVGIALYDSAGKLIPGALEQLDRAIQLTRENMMRWGQSFADQQSLLSAAADIFDRDPNDIAAAAQDQLGLLAKMAPALFGDLGNLNLGSADARAVLERRIRDVFARAQIPSILGGLRAEDLGQFSSIQELVSGLLSADNALDAFTDAAKEATDAILNVPQVLNLALIRYRASTAGGVGGGGSSGTPLGSGGPTDVGGFIPTDRPVLTQSFGPGSIVIDASAKPVDQVLEELGRYARLNPGSSGVLDFRLALAGV